MRKQLKHGAANFPMPVLIISTYNEDGTIDCMNAAWGTLEDMDLILLELTKDHKTSENIERNKAFVISPCDAKNVIPGDYVGVVSAKKEKDKFAKTKWHATKSENVNAPIIEELPLSLECELDHIVTDDGAYIVYGKIVGVSVDEAILNEKGKIDMDKAQFITYNSIDNSYRVITEEVGKAFSSGLTLK